MDSQPPRGNNNNNNNEGFAQSNLFADSQQYHHAYDNLFSTAAEPNFNDAGWGVNASVHPNASRVLQPAPGWQQGQNHLAANPVHTGLNGQPSPYPRSLSHSPAPFGQTTFGDYGNQANFHYHQQPPYDPSLFNQPAIGHNFTPSYVNPNPVHEAGTIAPQALEHENRVSGGGSRYSGGDRTHSGAGQSRSVGPIASGVVNHQALVTSIPNGKPAGAFSIIDFQQLAGATNSERIGNFVNVGKEAFEWPINRATTTFSYVPRKSKNELRKLVGNDKVLLAKIGRNSNKAKTFSTESALTKSFTAAKSASSPSEIKDEQDSSSSEESSDDDGSSYTSDEDLESSPLPAKRPDTPKGAVEYDTIKALWRSKRKSIDSDDIRKGIVDFWDIVKTVRDRWKIDAAAVGDAEEKKRVGELPLLKSRVKDQRDMIEAAFKAAFKHGHRSIIELMAENPSLIFLCYQFLLDRFKAEDINGSLSRALLEMMTAFTTLTDEVLEKTHLSKVLPRYIKKGDAKTQFYAKRITGNAAAATKVTAGEPKVAKSTGATSPPNKRPEPAAVVGVKRSANSIGDGGAQKKIATSARNSGVTIAAKPNGSSAKPVPATDASKVASTARSTNQTAPAAAAVKTKTVVAKPSGFFSSLQSATKKPGTSIKGVTSAGAKPAERKVNVNVTAPSTAAPKSTFSFAETMANLAKPKEEKPSPKPEKQVTPETPETKAKRLRKEARRKLHVSFKAGEDLVQIRYFTHDPEEEIGHNSSQMRDVADVGGEGRMLKLQNQIMDIDEEEDMAEEEPKLIDFKTPSLIDFSVVELEERQRNYAPHGGGELQPTSPERIAREKYEANTLIVFYADVSDIPPNPREPPDPYSGESLGPTVQFGEPDEKYAARGRHTKTAQSQRYAYPQPPAAPVFDLSALTKLNQYANQQPQPPDSQPSMPQVQPQIDLQKILGDLQQYLPPQLQQPQQPQPPQNAAATSFSNTTTPAGVSGATTQQAAQPNGQVDLAGILAALNAGQAGTGPAAPMGGGYGAPDAGALFGFASQPPPQEGQQQLGSVENAERKRMREGNAVVAPGLPYKTKTCRFWRQGTCMKGDGCTYLHEEVPDS